MAFSSYDEFRAACADPTRCYNVSHRVDTGSLQYNANSQDLIPPAVMWVNTAPATSNGALLNHTSTIGSTKGVLGVPLKMPSVVGRSWHLYSVDVAVAGQASMQALTLFDALWYGTFYSNNSIVDFAIPAFPTLTRYVDGKYVYPLPCIQPNGLAAYNLITFTGTTYDNVSGVTENSFYRRENASPAGVIPIMSNAIPPIRLFNVAQAGLGRGGFKSLSNINLQYAIATVTGAAFMVRPLLRIPIAKSSDDYRSLIKFPLFSRLNPYVVLPPGSDGNYACLFFGIEVGGDSTNLAAHADCTVRLQFVEG